MPITQSPLTNYQIALLQAQRQQRLAEALQQQSFQPIESYDSGVLKAPLSPTQGLARMLQAYGSNKAYDKSIQNMGNAYGMQYDMLRNMYGGGSPISGSESSSGTPVSPPINTLPPYLQSQQPISVPQQNQPMNQDSSQQDGMGLRLPPNLSPDQTAMLSMVNPALTNEIVGSYNKFQPPISMRPGSVPIDPFTGKVMSSAPEIGAAQAANEGQIKLSQTLNSPVTFQGAGGQQITKLGRDVFGNPSAGSVPVRPSPIVPSMPPQGSSPSGIPGQIPQGQNDPWATMPKLQIPQGMGETTFTHSIMEKQGTTAAELSQKYGQQADAANNRMMLNNQALDLVNKATTGPGAANIATVKNVLTSRFGVPEDDFQNTPSATIALQKDLVNLATQKAKQQFGSRISTAEVMLMLTKASPNTDMPKAAIQYLLHTDNAQAGYQIKQAQDLGKYLNNNGDPMRFEGWYSNNFPMSNALNNIHLQTGNQVPVTRTINGKNYIKQNGQWFQQ